MEVFPPEPRIQGVSIKRQLVSNVFSCQSRITDLSTPEYWNWSRGSAANLSTSCAILLCSCLARATTWTSCEQIFCCMYCKSLEQNRTQWFKQTRLNLSTNAGNSVKIEPSLQQTLLLKTRRLSLIKIKFLWLYKCLNLQPPFPPIHRQLQRYERTGKEYGCFPVWDIQTKDQLHLRV